MKKQQTRNSTAPRTNDMKYADLALLKLQFCDRNIARFDGVGTIVESLIRMPPISARERDRAHTVIKMLLDIVEKFQSDIGLYRELVLAVLMDARGVPDERLSADDALRMMREIEASNTLAGPSPKRARSHVPAAVARAVKSAPHRVSRTTRAA